MDDSGLAVALDKPGMVYSSKIDDEFRALDRLLCQVESEKPVHRLLADDRLGAARQMVRDLLAQLRSL